MLILTEALKMTTSTGLDENHKYYLAAGVTREYLSMRAVYAIWEIN